MLCAFSLDGQRLVNARIYSGVARTTIIVAEPIPFEGLSTRKLVLETAYYNVLTAYSIEELEESVVRFPFFDAIVIHGDLPQYSSKTASDIRNKVGKKPIIVLSSSGHQSEPSADVVLSSHDPQVLLAKVREYFDSPKVEDLLRRSRRK